MVGNITLGRNSCLENLDFCVVLNLTLSEGVCYKVARDSAESSAGITYASYRGSIYIMSSTIF